MGIPFVLAKRMKLTSIIRDDRVKWITLSGLMLLTVALHYGLMDLFFGHAAWTHAIHSRFCYIPIAVAASWFGIRGGLISAAIISLLVVPLLLADHLSASDLSAELVEIVFYFAVGVVIGGLSDRQTKIRRQHEEARLQLERSHKLSLVGQMAAGVAHEIKNPLASIKGAIEILTDPRTTQADKEEFKRLLLSEVRRIDSTVVEFLQLARPKEAQLQPMLVSTVIDILVRQLKAQFTQLHLRLAHDVQNHLWILGDAEKIHQVMLNLMLNAAEASPPGSSVSIKAYKQQGSIRLTVSDQGAGIGEAERSRIFEPFYTTKTAGAGLGLTIVKSIVDQHRGEISITSEPGKGTVAHVSFPAYEPTKEEICA